MTTGKLTGRVIFSKAAVAPLLCSRAPTQAEESLKAALLLADFSPC